MYCPTCNAAGVTPNHTPYRCSCCGNSVHYCRCYTSAKTFGWPMRPEWEEARRLSEATSSGPKALELRT